MAGLYFGEKNNVLRLDLKECREGFFRRRGRSFHADWMKMEKAQEPTVESLVLGIWRLRVSEAEQSDGGCVKLKAASHRGKTWQCTRYIHSKLSWSLCRKWQCQLTEKKHRNDQDPYATKRLVVGIKTNSYLKFKKKSTNIDFFQKVKKSSQISETTRAVIEV